MQKAWHDWSSHAHRGTQSGEVQSKWHTQASWLRCAHCCGLPSLKKKKKKKSVRIQLIPRKLSIAPCCCFLHRGSQYGSSTTACQLCLCVTIAGNTRRFFFFPGYSFLLQPRLLKTGAGVPSKTNYQPADSKPEQAPSGWYLPRAYWHFVHTSSPLGGSVGNVADVRVQMLGAL